MKLDFRGRTVLVTGATRGIGLELAVEFAAAGANLHLTGTNEASLDILRSYAKLRGCAKFHAVDLGNERSTQLFFETLGRLKRLDVCINCAGVNQVASVEDTDPAVWDWIIRVNLSGPFGVTRAVAPIMKRQRYGRIVNISSIFGLISKRLRSAYSSSKFGLRGLTVASALDLADHGILVNAVAPGFVKTELTERVLGEHGMREVAENIPLGRLARPSEIAPAVLFLASELNTYITGETLVVDGGVVNV